MRTRGNIVAELLAIRHPDTYLEYNATTGEQAVSRPNIVPHPDSGIQLASFFLEASLHAAKHFAAHQFASQAHRLPYIDIALSTPRVRGIATWADIYSLVGGIANHNPEFQSQAAVEAWIKARHASKLVQEGLSDWADSIEQIKSAKAPRDLFTTIETLEQEIRLEQLAMPYGVTVDDRLRDAVNLDIGYSGMDKNKYSALIEQRPIRAERWMGMLNVLNEIALQGKDRPVSNSPLLAVIVTHATNLNMLEALILSRGHEEDIVSKTYGELKREYSSIPHGSGLQIFIYENGEIACGRIYSSTHGIRERGTQPPEPTYLSHDMLTALWRK